jgi:hypothetical protein
MDQTLFALPILPGQSAPARAFLTELEGPRKGQYAASEGRLGLVKETWAIQATPAGELYVVYFAGEDIGVAFAAFAPSRDAFDVWFKRQSSRPPGRISIRHPPGR